MKILVLNGSPRVNGTTSNMIRAFQEGAESVGHEVEVIMVSHESIAGCMACEYCHQIEQGVCIQKDGMEKVYNALMDADTLVLASPIYYHGVTGQLKCAIDRLYAMLYPKEQITAKLKKVAMILSSGDPDMYDGARFSYTGDFIDYLGLEDLGIFTAYGDERESSEQLQKLKAFGASLV